MPRRCASASSRVSRLIPRSYPGRAVVNHPDPLFCSLCPGRTKSGGRGERVNPAAVPVGQRIDHCRELTVSRNLCDYVLPIYARS